jgi:uncharacterized protein
MRWEGGRRSSNIEDRRGQRGGSRAVVGGGIGTVVLLLLALALGVDPGALLRSGGGPAPPVAAPAGSTSPEEDRLTDFVSVILADTEDTWGQLFRGMGATYQEPTLVLFTGSVQSGCGYASAQVGPFYCPADRRIYLDLVFFDQLHQRFGAPGDMAQAYVIAHEVGHHVQTLLGISAEVSSRQRALPTEEANDLSVRQELQADCFAGIWGHFADRSRGLLEVGDLEEALAAAAAIGDDRLQERARGYSVPESFTHGTSAQRARWFRAGFETGDPARCDTFGVANL